MSDRLPGYWIASSIIVVFQVFIGMSLLAGDIFIKLLLPLGIAGVVLLAAWIAVLYRAVKRDGRKALWLLVVAPFAVVGLVPASFMGLLYWACVLHRCDL